MNFKDFEELMMKRRANRKELYETKKKRLDEDFERDEARDEETLRLGRNTDIKNRQRKDTSEHENYKHNEQLKQEKIEFDKSERGRTLKAKEEARINIKRDIKMGLTPKQLRRKYLNPKDTVRDMNKDAQRETDKMLKYTNLSKLKVNLDDLV